MRRAAVPQLVYAGAVAALGTLLTVYVSREDDYRADGTSRWDSREAQGLTVAAIAACGVAAGLRVYAVARREGRPPGPAWLADLVAYLLVAAAYVGNTAN